MATISIFGKGKMGKAIGDNFSSSVIKSTISYQTQLKQNWVKLLF